MQLMDTLIVVKQIYSLAESAGNRESIVKDQGCLPGLVLFLDSQEKEATLLVLKTLHLLAEHVPNRKVMFREFGMMPSLRKIMEDKKEGYKNSSEIKKLASLLYNKLDQPLPPVSKQRVPTVAPTKQKFFVGASNKKANLITLQIAGLYDKSCRMLCEQNLLPIKGVVSFTFNMMKQRCMVRVTPGVTAEMLCEAIDKTMRMTAEQVVKNVSGEEVMISFGHTPEVPEKVKEKVHSNLPDYLPEDDEIETGYAALAKNGSNGSNDGWLSGVTNFITSTLYW